MNNIQIESINLEKNCFIRNKLINLKTSNKW